MQSNLRNSGNNALTGGSLKGNVIDCKGGGDFIQLFHWEVQESHFKTLRSMLRTMHRRVFKFNLFVLGIKGSE
jgi:hypothetical protein